MQDRSLKEKWITSVCSFYMSKLSFDAVLKQLASNLPAYIMVKEKNPIYYNADGPKDLNAD